MNATAARIDYDQNRDTVIFSGDAVVKQPGRGSISGERIVYNMATGQVQSGAAAGGGRVNLTFEPRNKAPADDRNKAGHAEPPQPDDDECSSPRDSPSAPARATTCATSALPCARATSSAFPAPPAPASPPPSPSYPARSPPAQATPCPTA